MPDEALTEIVRGRLEGSGPVAQDALAACLGLAPSELASPLAALEVEGFALRGRFTPSAQSEEWCERRLLARIHQYTVKRLRAEIEPVAARDYLRFLCGWRRATPDARMEGADALDNIVAQLEGFEAPAIAWETEILPLRLAGYEPAWLDDLCLAGRATWARLRQRNKAAGEGRAAPVRTTPITLLVRRNAALWVALSGTAEGAAPGPRAQQVSISFATTAHRFSTRSCRAPDACARRSRKPWPTRRLGARQLGQLRRSARIASAFVRAKAGYLAVGGGAP